ncbi:hypothetical protein AVEN_160023-1 [Araneus ventricosus]|uniref:Uncharacterized protein n=1 Tax=Araneus ventricosus TaxID=182803 RepID=A0A4Y2NJG8_ARAVE|nr:hypothetical protein AVEN_160023-1 [Araneus ventricosus]
MPFTGYASGIGELYLRNTSPKLNWMSTIKPSTNGVMRKFEERGCLIRLPLHLNLVQHYEVHHNRDTFASKWDSNVTELNCSM